MNCSIIADIVEPVMEQAGERLFIFHTDPVINTLLETGSDRMDCRLHFSQNEEFFLYLPDEILVPSMPIHHDVQSKQPAAERKLAIVSVITQLLEQVPGMFKGFRWFFDATDSLKACFYQLMKADDTVYLVLQRIDLGYRPMATTLAAPGSNDRTAAFRTRRIFVDTDVVPLIDTVLQTGKLEMRVRQSVSETWIGETGRGYFVQGIWLDREITKFFTKLILPDGKRLYPYFPLNCKFRAICYQPFRLDPEGRRRAVSALHLCRAFLEDRVPEIEKALHRANFSEDLPLFRGMRANAPRELLSMFEPLAVRAYLNQEDMKEYELFYETK